MNLEGAGGCAGAVAMQNNPNTTLGILDAGQRAALPFTTDAQRTVAVRLSGQREMNFELTC